MDAAGVSREEVFTERRIGTIRKLIPVTTTGADYTGRKMVFEGQTTLLTPSGPLPLRFEIEADRLADALERFGGAAEKALEQTLEEVEDLRRRAQSSLIVPGRGSPGIGNIGGEAGGGKIVRP